MSYAVGPTASAAQPSTAEPSTTHQPESSTTDEPQSPLKDYDTPTGLTLQVDFAWTKFKNTISEKSSTGQLTPLYIQHFRPTKPNLLFDHADTNKQFATGSIKGVAISADCKIDDQDIALKPLSRWYTKYNYLSTVLSPDGSTPMAVTWQTNSSMKTWNFVCLDANQLPIAKFSVNLWALKEVGNFHFTQSAGEISKAARDEIVVVGITLFYVMYVRMNNPLNLLGSIFGKAEKVGTNGEGMEMQGKKTK